MTRSASNLAPIAVVACLISGCGSRISDPGRNALILKYEDWLKTRLPARHSGVGAPKASEEVVFDTDLRDAPERGLSKVHLKSAPGEVSYVYQRQTDRLISAAFCDDLAAIMVPVGRWAYIEESGRFLFAPIFRGANNFDHGVATALLGPAAAGRAPAPEGTWVLLDTAGSMKALDPSIASIREFSAGMAEFTTRDHKSGYIDRTGSIRIPAAFAATRPFCADGTAPVRADKTWGLIDVHGSFIVRPDYDDIHCFSEGLAAAKKGKWGFIDPAGTFIVPPRFDGVSDFSEGLASFENRTWPNGREYIFVSNYGFIDRTGSAVVQPTYSWAYPFQFGIAKVGTKQIDWRIYPLSFIVPADPHYTLWKYIDRRGRVVAMGGRQ